jgi:hypothetical protein
MEAAPRTGPVTADAHTPVRGPYHSPVLRLYGALTRLTQSIGSRNGDAGQGMML